MNSFRGTSHSWSPHSQRKMRETWDYIAPAGRRPVLTPNSSSLFHVTYEPRSDCWNWAVWLTRRSSQKNAGQIVQWQRRNDAAVESRLHRSPATRCYSASATAAATAFETACSSSQSTGITVNEVRDTIAKWSAGPKASFYPLYKSGLEVRVGRHTASASSPYLWSYNGRQRTDVAASDSWSRPSTDRSVRLSVQTTLIPYVIWPSNTSSRHQVKHA